MSPVMSRRMAVKLSVTKGCHAPLEKTSTLNGGDSDGGYG